MGELVPLFLLSDGMGQFVREKLEYINILSYPNNNINNCHMAPFYY